jgi:type III secretion protein T
MYGLTVERIHDVYSIYTLMTLCIARPLAFALIFTAFAWGQLNSGLLRLVFSMVISLPVLTSLWVVAHQTVETMPAPLPVMMIKELFIGFMLGFLLSLPFEALAVAGGVIDNYRGSNTSIPGANGELTPFSQILMVVALWLFASLDGFFIVVDMLYATYGFWPLTEMIPPLTPAGLTAVFSFLSKLLLMSLIIAGPMLLLMGAVDFVFAIAGKIGKQLNVTFLSVSVKSIIVVLVLPPFSLVLVRVISGEIVGLPSIEAMMRAAIQ